MAIEVVGKITRQVPFKYAVPAVTGVLLSEPSPVEGKLMSVTLHFPDGCNALVEIICYINVRQILPLSGNISLNNATITLPINESIGKKDKLMVRIKNTDAVNPHTPSIIMNVEGAP